VKNIGTHNIYIMKTKKPLKKAQDGMFTKDPNAPSPTVKQTKKKKRMLSKDSSTKNEIPNPISKDIPKKKTGGMVNSNAKVFADNIPGSNGVKSGVNPKASASTKPGGRVGGTSTAPKDATPKAKYGMTMKPTMKKGGSMKKK
jgi:hypothetical protein